MPTLNLSIKYSVDTKTPFSAQDLKDKFLSHLPNDFNCNQFVSDETIDFYIQSAKEQLEAYLGIKIGREVITERHDFIVDDWVQWGYIKTTYPVQSPVSLAGYLGNVQQVEYPFDWITVRETSDGKTFNREFRIMPIGSGATYNNTSALFLGSFNQQLSWWRQNRNVPNYWKLKYVTGFVNDVIPTDILQALGMIATIPILGIISDAYTGKRGLGFGVSSKSISLDGLSQSVSSFNSGQTGIFGARMKQYTEALFGANGRSGLLDTLKDAYSAIIFTVC
jgi:hypothetical protein